MTAVRCLVVLFLAGACVGCKGEGDEPYEAAFNRCTGPTDCSGDFPDCRAVDPLATGASVSWCTRVCDDDGPPCTIPGAFGGRAGVCLGVDAAGELDPAAAEKLCFLGCSMDPECLFDGPGDDFRYGNCVEASYGASDSISICVDEG
jgi:hypothetical protein